MNRRLLLSSVGTYTALAIAGGMSLQGSAQTTVTFTASGDGEHLPLDSILVVNITQGGDTMLYAPDTVLVLDLSTGMGDHFSGINALRIRPPYPNPFDGSSRFQLEVDEPGQLVLSVYDLTGRVVASSQRNVGSGVHAFTYQGGAQGMLILVAEINGRKNVERMLAMPTQGSSQAILIHDGSGAQAELGGPKDLGPFMWSSGDSLKYVGYVTRAPVPLGLDSLVQGSIPVASIIVPFAFVTQVDILEEADLAILDALPDTVLPPEQILIRDGLTAYDILQDLDPDFPGMAQEGEVRDILTPRQQLDLLLARMAYYGWFMIDDDQHIYAADGADGPAQTGLAYGLGNKFFNVRARPTDGSCTHRIYGSDCSGMIYQMGSAASLEFPRAITNSNVEAMHDTTYWQTALDTEYPGLKVKNKGQLPIDDIRPGDVIMWYGLSDGVCKWKHIGQVFDAYGFVYKGIYQSNGDGSGCTQNLSASRGPCFKELTSGWLSAFLGNSPNCVETYDVFRMEMRGCQDLTSVTDIDGNSYPVVTIGDQCWMAANLATMTYRDGTPITNVTDNAVWAGLTTEAFSAYNNNFGNMPVHGLLYNWLSATAAQGLCPAGWHLPADLEWQQLESVLGMPGDELNNTGPRGTLQNVGGKLKELTTWGSPNNGATNESGFTGTASGLRTHGGQFQSMISQGHWWSASEIDATLAWHRYITAQFTGVYRYEENKLSGRSVRCIRD